MEDQPMKTGGLQSELCCIIFIALILIFQYYTYGTIDSYSYYLIIIVAFFMIFSIYNRFSIRRRVFNHLLHFQNGRVAIQKVMTDLQLGFFDVMILLDELRKKKKIPIEIEEKTGEVIVGKTDKKPKTVISEKSKIVSKSMKPEKVIKEEKKTAEQKINKCLSCGAEIGEKFNYCPGCGRPSKRED